MSRWEDLGANFRILTNRSKEDEKPVALQTFNTVRWLILGILGFNLALWGLYSLNILLEADRPVWDQLALWVNGLLLISAILFAWEQQHLLRKSKSIADEKNKADEKNQPKEISAPTPPKSDAKPTTILPNPSFIALLIQFGVGGLICLAVASIASVVIIKLTTGSTESVNVLFTICILIASYFALDRARIAATTYRRAFEQAEKDAPLTQQRINTDRPEWIRQLPLEDVNDQKSNFRLISDEQIAAAEKSLQDRYAGHGHAPQKEVLEGATVAIKKDIEFLNNYLLPTFRERDYDAKYYQRAYRRYQIGYMLLAVLAGIFGSLLALKLNDTSIDGKRWVAIFGFLETVVALATTYLATLSGRENTLEKWLENRQKAEGLRREFQRYLVRLTPYDIANTTEREANLQRNVASINLVGEPDITIDTSALIKRAAEGDSAILPPTQPDPAAPTPDGLQG